MGRTAQIIKYGWRHAGQVPGGGRVSAFLEIVRCYRKYRMWSNQYMAVHMYEFSPEEKARVGEEMLIKNLERDEWHRDFCENKRFLNKYMDMKYELQRNRAKRNKAYQERYNMGKGAMVEHSVEISRQHYLPGTIRMGDNVLLAKNVFIDYSGHVVIGNDVQITDGVHIITHDHKHHRGVGTKRDYKDNDIQSHIEIADGAVIGTRAVVLSDCHYIGKYARIGAGAVVTKDIPDYAVAVGVPARVVKINAYMLDSDDGF